LITGAALLVWVDRLLKGCDLCLDFDLLGHLDVDVDVAFMAAAQTEKLRV